MTDDRRAALLELVEVLALAYVERLAGDESTSVVEAAPEREATADAG